MIQTISQLIAQCESGGNPFAVRFEPAYHPDPEQVAAYAKAHGISHMTAEVLCACSWGMYQEMGDNLLRAGMSVTFQEFANDQAMQTEFFGKYLAADHLDYTLADVVNDEAKRLEFARLYNGPGAPERYAAYMMAVYQRENGQAGA